MADYNSVLKAIEEKSIRETNLFNSKFEVILEQIAKELEFLAVSPDLDPLEFDYQFEKILKDTGYYELVNGFIDDSYDKSYNEIKALFELGGISIVYTEEDMKRLLAIKSIDTEFFKHIGTDASNLIKRDLYKYSFSDISKIDMAANIRTSLQGTGLAKYANTYAQTALSNYYQDVIDIKSSDFEDAVFIYRGVDDKKNRKFCQCLLDQEKYYTLSDASKIRTDKRRQYNCRHVIAPMDIDFAKAEGYKKGSFTC